MENSSGTVSEEYLQALEQEFIAIDNQVKEAFSGKAEKSFKKQKKPLKK